MKQSFLSLWNHLEKVSVLKTDSQSMRRQKVTLVMVAILRRQKVTLVMVAILSCLMGVITVTRYYIISGISYAVILPGIFVLVVGTAILLFFVTKRFGVLLYPFLLTILCIPVIFHRSDGGFSGQTGIGILFWAILAPLGALMFQSIRKAVWWFAAYLVLVIVSLYLDEHFVQFTVTAPYKEIVVSHGINLMMLSVTVFFSMMYFVNAFQKEHNKAEKLVVELRESNDELETTLNELRATQIELVQSEKMAALGKLAAGVAHEINNPIGALKSTADTSTQCLSRMEQFLEESEKFGEIRDDSKFQKFLKILRDNSQVFVTVSDRVSNTVKSFINFARLDKAGFDRVDIHQGIDDTLVLIQHEIKAGTEVVKEYGELPKIACYPNELNQVFMNLLSNAAQAIETEGKITIRTFAEKGNVHIQIFDTGVGIPKEEVEKLFDPGFTKNGTRVKAGLGLFTSYNIVQKHDGKIEVESVVGQGSTFTIILPTESKE
jgi:signal transduction histidine kinase